MDLTRIRPEDFPSWQEYYQTYQYRLAEQYYIPLMQMWAVELRGRKVLDIGCGDGGFTRAIADAGAECTGVEVRDFGWQIDRPNLRFIQQDILADDAVDNLGGENDIIILRDVIEHIDLRQKKAFLAAVKKFMRPDAVILMTFPPFYSPFGLHQQTFLRGPLKKVPFLSWLPGPLLHAKLKLVGESEKALADVQEIRECRMTIRRFKQLVGELGFQIEEEKYFLVRPSHELRYGWKHRETRLHKFPLLNEILISGTVYKLSLTQL